MTYYCKWTVIYRKDKLILHFSAQIACYDGAVSPLMENEGNTVTIKNCSGSACFLAKLNVEMLTVECEWITCFK